MPAKRQQSIEFKLIKIHLVTPIVGDVNFIPIICIIQCPICIEYRGVCFNKQRGRLGNVDSGYTPEVTTWHYLTTSSLLKGAPSWQQFT